MEPSRELLLEITHCATARRCLTGTHQEHACGMIVRSQDVETWSDYQLPEPWSGHLAQAPLPLTAEEQAAIRRLAQDLPALWHAPSTTPADRKRLLRCLIRSVTLDSFSQVGSTRILVRWQTGATSEVTVPRLQPGVRTPQAVLERIRALAQTEPDERIAELLNAEGRLTATQHRWTKENVRRTRAKRRIPTGCFPYARQPGPGATVWSQRPKPPSSSTSPRA